MKQGRTPALLLHNAIVSLAVLRSGTGYKQPIPRHQRSPDITRYIAERLQIPLHPRQGHIGGVATLLAAVSLAFFNNNNFLLHAWGGHDQGM